MPGRTSHEKEANFHAERHLQVGAALLLGLAVLVAVVLRAGLRNVFPAGWWHRW